MRLNPLFLSNLRRRQSGIYAQPEGITWESPYNMSATSGTVTIENRNFDCTDTGDTAGAAYATAAGAKYIFNNCRFRSKAACIWSNYSIGLELNNCIGECVNPGVSGVYNRGFLHGKYNWLVVRQCTMKGGGMRISSVNPTRLRIQENYCLNIEGRYSDGAGGYLNTTASTNNARQFFQINGALTCGSTSDPALIEWNMVENICGQSHPGGDMISVAGGASGLSTDPIKIRHNGLLGNSSYDPTVLVYSGRGIMLEDGTGSYIDVEDNFGSKLTGMVVIDLDGHYSHVNISRNSIVFANKFGGVNYAGSGPAFPYSANALSTGTYQVWTDNAWSYQSLSYHATGADDGNGPFVKNSGNTGNSAGTGWSEGAIASESDESAVRTTFLAAAATAGKTQLGSTIAPWW